MAVANAKFAKGLVALNEVMTDSVDILDEWNEGSLDTWEAVGKIQEALEDTFGVKVSADFIKENLKKGHFLKESIMDFLRKCPLFEEDRFEIIERGIEAYFDEDYITMIHLLIPQVENAIRNLVELLDESTLESKKSNNTLQLKTLDTLLREKSLLNISENFVYYMRVLYTDPRGWNLRNLVCHGLSPLKYFNPVTADRIFHSLICIGSITTK